MSPLKWALVTLGVLALLLLIMSLGCFNYLNGTRDDGINYETGLTAQYLSNQNYLSAYISGFYEKVSVQEAQSKALNEILTDAVKGRYEDGGYSVNSPMFAAIVEAYPEAGVQEFMANWGKASDYISAGREGYRANQDKLLDMLRQYDAWRGKGMVKSNVVRQLGFPSERLEARIGERKWTGEAARDRMYL